jgi:hypothetical protein
MVTLTQLAQSTEPVQFQVTAMLDGSPYDPTGDAVAVAFVPVTSPPSSPDPVNTEWNTATWETDSGNPSPSYWASVLVGPLNGGVSLTAGPYICYVRVTDNPAVPVKPGAYLIIT